jgi:hypothetical protein
MIVMVPWTSSLQATVNGVRSPVSLIRSTMNCPGWIMRATAGASTVMAIMSPFVSS